MVQNHLSRLAAPRCLGVKRKTTKWIARPMPGPHPLDACVTLSVLIRDVLEYAKTTKEVKMILNNKNILIDKKARTKYKFPVGLMDVVELPSLDEHYRMVYGTNGRLSLISIKKEQANLKLLKIVRKNVVRGGRMQLTFHDGRTILMDKFDGKVGDSVLFDIAKGDINKILHLAKDSLVYLSGGSHIGSFGRLKSVIKAKDLQSPKVVVDVGGKDYISFAKHVFVVGKDKPELELEVKK